MADKARRPPPNIKDELVRDGRPFSFFQALRLLRFFLAKGKTPPRDRDLIRESIRIKPNLSLGQPSSDIDKIEEMPGKTPSIFMTVNFLGLYGESSPLPVFYTEDLMDEVSEDITVAKDFIDTINYPLYLLFYRSWTKYRLDLKIVEEKDAQSLEFLYSLIGLGVEEVRNNFRGSYQILRYAGLLSQFPKSALGLKVLLTDALSSRSLDIIPCTKRRVKIPAEQKFFLGVSGNRLGQDSYLGEEIGDRMGKFTVRIGPINAPEFQRLLPGTPRYSMIQSLIRFYLMEPLESDLSITLAPNQAQGVSLGGGNWSKLGLDTWIIPAGYNRQVGSLYKLT